MNNTNNNSLILASSSLASSSSSYGAASTSNSTSVSFASDSSDIMTINKIFQRYLDIYRVEYGIQASAIKSWYTDTLWNFYTKDTSLACNAIFTPFLSILPQGLTRNNVIQKKIIIFVIYFDNEDISSQINSPRVLFSRYCSAPFAQYFLNTLKSQINNQKQKEYLNFLVYNEHIEKSKNSNVQKFIDTCNNFNQSL